MIARMASAWTHFWFRPAAPLGLIAARTLVSAHALWIVLSRPDLPDIVAWPAEFWLRVPTTLALRYLIFPLPPAVEWVLYALLHLALLASLVGVSPRLACLGAGVLLYHFAPFEEVLWHNIGPFFRGLTLPTLALFILSFAPVPRLNVPASPDFRWPLALIQVLFAFHYLFPGVGKLLHGGLEWASVENIRNTIIVGATSYPTPPPWAHAIVSDVVLVRAIGLGTLVFELLFPVVLFYPMAAWILIPIAVAGHVGITLTFGVFFLSMPLLLLYLDWEAIDRWHRSWSTAGTSTRTGVRPGPVRDSQ